MNNAIKRPALRYFGGKWRMAGNIIPLLPAHEHYCEPFGGAASVLIQKRRSDLETYNDLNSDVVEYFRIVRDHGDELLRRLNLTPYSRSEYLAAHEHSDDPIERARRYVVRSWQSQFFKQRSRSGWRAVNTLGGRSCAPCSDWCRLDHLIAIGERFKGVQIECDDALAVIRRHDAPKTLFYVDPPYAHETRVDIAAYKHELTNDQHVEMLDLLNACRGMVVLSGYASAAYEDKLPGWDRHEFKARINSGEGAKIATEVVWIKPNSRRLQNAIEFDLSELTSDTE